MLHTRFVISILVILISGCANFTSISRSSSLGSIGGNAENTAIHLDAQQRVILSKNNMKKVCAEPSPDALAAYAASLGLGVHLPKGSGSLAQSNQSSVAAMGLRTQSITLMRDALYRICEASMNEMIEPVHNATLLGRGMDLTAVVLAVEQLTGAVVASQPMLMGSSEASASSSAVEMLHANQQVLGEAIIFRDSKKTAFETAQKVLDDKKTEVATQQGIFDKADAKLVNEENTPPENKASVATELEHKTEGDKLTKFKSEEGALTQDVKSKEALYKQSEEVVAAIEKTRDASLSQVNTMAVTKASGSGNFNNISGFKNFHENAEKIEHIAGAVKGMIEFALNKDYSVEACLAFLSSTVPANKNDVATRTACFELVRAKVTNQYNIQREALRSDRNVSNNNPASQGVVE